MPSQSNAPMFVAAVSKMLRKSEVVGDSESFRRIEWRGSRRRGKHPKRRDDGKIEAISHGHEQITSFAVDGLDLVVVARIHFADPRLLIDDLRLVVAEAVEFMGEFVVRQLADDDADHLFASNLDAVDTNGVRRATLIRERIILVAVIGRDR